MSTTNHVVAGFSLINRWLLYTSSMLAPAQFISGIANNCPSNLGFLAYNLYTQVIWYQAVRSQKMHAMSLILPHFNMVFSLTYLGGISSGNLWMGIPLGLGSVAVMGLNTASSWIGWMTNQPDGFGVYRFFFFGWRTLNANWHKFTLVWQIFDTIEQLGTAIIAIAGCVLVSTKLQEVWKPRWYHKFAAIPVGAAIILLVIWPNILWTELIVSHNHIESDTDWIAVWLFIVQVAALLNPPSSAFMGCVKRFKMSDV